MIRFFSRFLRKEASIKEELITDKLGMTAWMQMSPQEREEAENEETKVSLRNKRTLLDQIRKEYSEIQKKSSHTS